MSIQTVYGDTIAVGFAGGLANEEPRVLISRTVEDSGGIDFGLAVMQGVNDKGCIVSTGAFLGVTVREQSVTPEVPNGFAYQESARIMTKGVIWVVAAQDVVAGDIVHGRANGAIGKSGGTLKAGARWDTTAVTGELAQLRLA